MPEVAVKSEGGGEVLSRGPTPFPSRTRLQASTSPCRQAPPPKKRASIKELWHRLEKAWADFQWDFRRRHKGQKSFAFVCRSNGPDEPWAGGSACHRGPDLLWELISIIWGELYRLRVYIHAWESKIRAKWTETNLLYSLKKANEEAPRSVVAGREKKTKEKKNRKKQKNVKLSRGPFSNVGLVFKE